VTTERVGDWIATASGRRYWPMDPRAEDVWLPDIAAALSKLCRFGGHTSRFYSVAEHSVLVSYVVPPHLALQGLMHDATEAYVVDVPRPLKRMLPDYQQAERLNWAAIAQHFGLPAELDPAVHEADNAVLFAEKAALMPNSPPWGWSVPAADVKVQGAGPGWAERVFLSRFAELVER
jgi:hypothetical protein